MKDMDCYSKSIVRCQGYYELNSFCLFVCKDFSLVMSHTSLFAPYCTVQSTLRRHHNEAHLRCFNLSKSTSARQVLCVSGRRMSVDNVFKFYTCFSLCA